MKDPNQKSKDGTNTHNAENSNNNNNHNNILQNDNLQHSHPNLHKHLHDSTLGGSAASSSNDSYSKNAKTRVMMDKKNNRDNPFKELILSTFNTNENYMDYDSGKLDQWIERAHQMLADSVNEEDVKALLQHQKQQQQQESRQAKAEFSPSQIPKEKSNKVSANSSSDKINPKFTSIAANEVSPP